MIRFVAAYLREPLVRPLRTESTEMHATRASQVHSASIVFCDCEHCVV
jgi:hypothetical protein